MLKEEKAIQTLRAKGYRLTPQRLLVLSIVSQCDSHMSVDEVFKIAKDTYQYIDIATVYRTLHALKHAGVVTELAIGDRMHYELTDPDARHHHMVCRLCRKAFNLSPHYLEEFHRALLNEFGFAPDLEHFTVSGLCADCRANKT